MNDDRIIAVEKHRGYYMVHFMDAPMLRVQMPLMRERRLSVGDEINAEEYARWLGERQGPLALEKAVSLLATRARGEREMERRLTEGGFAPRAIAYAMAKLKARGLLDDEAYVRAYVEAHSAREGARRMTNALRGRGVSSEDIQRVLTERPQEDETIAAAAMARKLARRFIMMEDAEKRLTQALVRRGFDWDSARSAARQALEEE